MPLALYYHPFSSYSWKVDWLPPAEMTDEIHRFDARVGGRISDVVVLPAG